MHMKDFSTKNLIIVVVSIVIGFAIALIAPPEGLDVIGMRYIGIFVGLLIVLSTNALPAWAASLGALVLMVVAGCGKIPEVFSAFSGSIVWLMIAVFAFSAAVINSGLMTRIALSLLKVFPKNYFGQVLSLMVVGTILSPMIPSSNAKVNLLAPIATEMTKAVGYEKKSKPALGLFTAAFIPPYIGSHAFLTGNANVAYMVGLMGITFTWIGYFQLAALWLVILLVLTFVYCMTYCKPSEKIDLPDGFFAEKYKELGKMTFGEKVSAIVVVLCLVFWIGQPVFGIDAGMVTMVGVVILTMFGVLNTKAFQTQIPWGLIMFIGALIGGSGLMGKLGVSDFIAANIGPLFGPCCQQRVGVRACSARCYLGSSRVHSRKRRSAAHLPCDFRASVRAGRHFPFRSLLRRVCCRQYLVQLVPKPVCLGLPWGCGQ